MLTKEKSDELELFKKLKSGDKKARDKIVEKNIGLVVNIAASFSRTYGIDFDDLLQEGFIGLLIAVDRFDYTKGYKFSTYAVPYIKRYIVQYVRKNIKLVHIPVRTYHKMAEVNSVQKEIERSKGEASLEEISDVVGLPVEKVAVLMNLKESMLSLNQKAGNEIDAELMEIIADEESEENIYREYFRTELRKALEESFGILTEKERKVLEMRYGLNGFGGRPLKIREIAKMFNVSNQRIKNIETSALNKLRNSYKAKKLLADFL
jgi:RNA polymerase primary sigma factor